MANNQYDPIQQVLEDLIVEIRQEIFCKVEQECEENLKQRLQNIFEEIQIQAGEELKNQIISNQQSKFEEFQQRNQKVNEKKRFLEEMRRNLEEKHGREIEEKIQKKFIKEKENLIRTANEDIKNHSTIKQVEQSLKQRIKQEYEEQRSEELARKDKLLKLNYRKKLEMEKEKLIQEYEDINQKNYNLEMAKIESEREQIKQEMEKKQFQQKQYEDEKKEIKKQVQAMTDYYAGIIEQLQQKLEKAKQQKNEKQNRDLRRQEIEREQLLKEEMLREIEILNQKEEMNKKLQESQNILNVQQKILQQKQTNNENLPLQLSQANKAEFNQFNQLINNNNSGKKGKNVGFVEDFQDDFASKYLGIPQSPSLIQKSQEDQYEKNQQEFVQFKQNLSPFNVMSIQKQDYQNYENQEVIPEYDSQRVAEKLIQQIQNVNPLEKFVQDRLMESGLKFDRESDINQKREEVQKGMSKIVQFSQTPQKNDFEQQNQSDQQSDRSLNQSQQKEYFDMNSELLNQKQQENLQKYQQKYGKAHGGNNFQKPKLSIYQQLFQIKKDDKPIDIHLKKLRKIVYQIFDWEDVYEKQLEEMKQQIFQRINEVILRYIGNAESDYVHECFNKIYSLQEEMDMSMKDRIEFIEKILKEFNGDSIEPLIKRLNMEIEYLLINQLSTREKQMSELLRQRKDFRKKIDTTCEQGFYKYNKRIYLAIMNINEKLSSHLFSYQKETKYQDFLWRGVSLIDLLKIDKWEDQLLQKEDLRKEIRDKINKKF